MPETCARLCAMFTRVTRAEALAPVARSERLAPMCCLFALLAVVGPRLVLVLVWIFGDRVELAFSSWVWPLLGLFFLPWTTLAYVLAWQAGGVEGGWDALLIGLGIVLDIVTYSSRSAAKRAGAWG
jgi:hypothetical protein